MLRWEDAGHTGIVFGAVPLERAEAAADVATVMAFVRDCAVPLLVSSGTGPALRGTATLMRAQTETFLLTAAHLLDDRVRLGDLMLPLPGGGWVNLDGARVCADADTDIVAVVPPRRTQTLLAGAWSAVPVSAVAGTDARASANEEPAHYPHYFLAGYPAAMTRLRGEWFAAKRLVVISGELPASAGETPDRGAVPDRAAHGHSAAHPHRDLLLEYSRTAPRIDGAEIHTPPLEGVSGAAIWAVRRVRGQSQLMIVGVQSSFRHSRYLRAHRLTPLQIRRMPL